MTDRAVSSTLGYVLTLAIAALLVGGLLTAGGNFVTTQRDVVVEEELTVVGQQLSANVEQADRLVVASSGADPVVQLNQTFPRNVARSQYVARLDADRDQLILTSTDPEQTVRINVTTRTDLRDSTAAGGEVTVRYDNATDQLVIDNA